MKRASQRDHLNKEIYEPISLHIHQMIFNETFKRIYSISFDIFIFMCLLYLPTFQLFALYVSHIIREWDFFFFSVFLGSNIFLDVVITVSADMMIASGAHFNNSDRIQVYLYKMEQQTQIKSVQSKIFLQTLR